MNRDNPFESNSSQVHLEGDHSGPLGGAIGRMVAQQGTENDWRNGINIPRPRIWDERPELIGQTVIPHTCEAREHGDNNGCLCDLLGTPVVITKIYETPFVGTPSYHIEGSNKTMRESEFSDETRGKDPQVVEGYILEGPDGKFLTAGFVWMPAGDVLGGYLHNSQVVRDIMNVEFPNGRPVKAHPASSKLDGSEKKLTGDAVPFEELQL